MSNSQHNTTGGLIVVSFRDIKRSSYIATRPHVQTLETNSDSPSITSILGKVVLEASFESTMATSMFACISFRPLSSVCPHYPIGLFDLKFCSQCSIFHSLRPQSVAGLTYTLMEIFGTSDCILAASSLIFGTITPGDPLRILAAQPGPLDLLIVLLPSLPCSVDEERRASQPQVMTASLLFAQPLHHTSYDVCRLFDIILLLSPFLQSFFHSLRPCLWDEPIPKFLATSLASLFCSLGPITWLYLYLLGYYLVPTWRSRCHDCCLGGKRGVCQTRAKTAMPLSTSTYHHVSSDVCHSAIFDSPSILTRSVSDSTNETMNQHFVRYSEPGSQITKTVAISVKPGATYGELMDILEQRCPHLFLADYTLLKSSRRVEPSITMPMYSLDLEVRPLLRAGMMNPTPDLNEMMKMIQELQQQLKEQQEITQKLADEKADLEDQVLEAKRDLETFKKQPVSAAFTTPTKPQLLDLVTATPYLKRAKSFSSLTGVSPLPKIASTSSTVAPSTTTVTTSSTSGTAPTSTSSISTPTVTTSTSTTTSSKSPPHAYKAQTTAEIKTYVMGESWEAWYQDFQLCANAGSWCDGVCVATLVHFMPPEIKKFLSVLSRDSFSSLAQLTSCLEKLFDKNEKTVEDRIREFHAIRCRFNETVANFYVRFVFLAARANETDMNKLITFFVDAIRPVKLHKRVKDRMRAVLYTTLDDVYALALAEEKEVDRLRKLRNEEVARANRNNRDRQQPRQQQQQQQQQRRVQVLQQQRPKNQQQQQQQQQQRPANSGSQPQAKSLWDLSTDDLVNQNRCAYCTKYTNNNNSPHTHKDCQAAYPFYKASEVRKFLKDNNQPPQRDKWPESKSSSSKSNHLKGK